MNTTSTELPIFLETAKTGVVKLNHIRHAFPAVYILYFVTHDAYYIGSTKNLFLRIRSHIYDLKANVHRNNKFQKLFNVATNKEMRVSFLCVSTREEGYDLEQILLDNYFPTGKLINIRTNVFSPLGLKVAEKTKIKLRAANKLQFSNPENINKHSAKTKEQWEMPGMRERISAAVIKSQKESSFDFDKMRKEIWKDPDVRRRIMEKRAKRRKAVMVDGKTYPSIGIAAKELGISVSCICHRLRNKRNTNYTFIIKEEITE